MNPGGGSGWDEPPLEIQIPDDARELERDVIAYHRELRARRRQRRLRKLTGPFAGQGTVMPLLASILAVCLVAGAMLSVATFSPSTAPENPSHHPSATAASGLRSATQRSSPANSAPASTSGASASGASTSGASTSSASTSGRGGTARPSGSANSSARSTPPASQFRPARPGGP